MASHEHRADVEVEHVAADQFEIGVPALELLGDRVNVAEAALEPAAGEDRGRAGQVVSDVGGGLRVGPDSAGAEPGPACYGRGGTEPTVTDAQVVLGRLDPDQFLKS